LFPENRERDTEAFPIAFDALRVPFEREPTYTVVIPCARFPEALVKKYDYMLRLFFNISLKQIRVHHPHACSSFQ